MNKPTKTLKLKQLSAAVMLLAGAQGAQALTPAANGTPDATIYISGGAAQDLAFGRTIENLAVPGSLDVFGDATTLTASNFGARWTVYYFTGAAPLASGTGGLQGKKVLVVKRSLGAAGYGVVPLIQNLRVQELNIFAFANATANPEPVGNAGTVASAAGNWRLVVDATNGATVAPKVASNAGILGVPAGLLLKQPATHNYPAPVAPVGTGVAADVFTNTYTAADIAGQGLTEVNAGGLVYGVAVNTKFYNVLQEAQRRAGTLPADTIIGSLAAYKDEARVPTLSREFVGSVLSGKINTWDQVKIIDRTVTPNVVRSLTDPVITAAAGLAGADLPTKFTAGTWINQVPVAVGNRNAGAAIGAAGYATFLNFPWTAGASGPITTATNAANEASGNTAPIVKLPGGVTATLNYLDDVDLGNNPTGTLNLTPGAKRWALALNSADANGSGSLVQLPEAAGKKNVRYVRIDGALPTVENAVNGRYPHWYEGELLYRGVGAPGSNNDAPKVDFITKFAQQLGTAASAADINLNLTTTWGTPGVIAFNKFYGNVETLPFSLTNPVSPYTHSVGAGTLGQVVPVVNAFTAGALPASRGVELR